MLSECWDLSIRLTGGDSSKILTSRSTLSSSLLVQTAIYDDSFRDNCIGVDYQPPTPAPAREHIIGEDEEEASGNTGSSFKDPSNTSNTNLLSNRPNPAQHPPRSSTNPSRSTPPKPATHPSRPTKDPPPPMSTSSLTYNPSVSDYRLPHLAAYPICWSGTLGLKNDMANVRMHYVSGNRDLAKASLPDTGSTLKIVERMRLEDSQLDGVAKKMETKSEHCMLLALPNGSEHEEIEHQSKILRSNFITYLQLKSAAGIVNVSNEDNQPAYIVHVFPSCDFANENLARYVDSQSFVGNPTLLIKFHNNSPQDCSQPPTPCCGHWTPGDRDCDRLWRQQIEQQQEGKKRLGPIHSSKYIYPVFNMSVLSSRVDVMKRIVKCLNVISVWMGWDGQIFVLVCFKMFTQLYFKAKELETKKKSCHILKYPEIVF